VSEDLAVHGWSRAYLLALLSLYPATSKRKTERMSGNQTKSWSRFVVCLQLLINIGVESGLNWGKYLWKVS